MQRRIRSTITVYYARIDKVALLLPVAMHELYVTGHTRIQADATYSNFRRFETQSRIKPPAPALHLLQSPRYDVLPPGEMQQRGRRRTRESRGVRRVDGDLRFGGLQAPRGMMDLEPVGPGPLRRVQAIPLRQETLERSRHGGV